MGIEIDLAIVREVEIDVVLCAGRKWLVFSMGIDRLGCGEGGRKLLVFCVRVENDLALVGASKLTCFFAWVVEIDLISV